MRFLNSENYYQNLQKIKTSPQVHKLNVYGKNFVYDANSMRLYEITEKEKDIDFDDLATDEVQYIEPIQENPSKHIVFQATYACNLKCRYCFVEHHYCDHKNTLTEQEHYDALEKFQTNGPYKMGWFGGEPLMNWETIFNVCEKVCADSEKKGLVPPSFHITTNATLMTEEIAEYCAKRGFSWIVSIDGPEFLHDNNRPYRDGQGSFHDVMRGLKFLANAYKGKPNPITLRATFDTQNFDILESTKFLNGLMYDGLAGHVSVEPSTLGEGCGTKSRIEELQIPEIRAIFEKQYEDTAKWFVDEIKAGRKPSLHHFEMPMQRLYDRDLAFNECGAGIGYISIGPGGKICACHREHRSEMGHMKEGGIDPIKQAKWRDSRLYNRNICPTCWRRYVCGGGCRCNSLLINNHINAPSTVECLFHDLHTRAAIWILSELTPEQRKLYSKSHRQMQQKPIQQKQMQQQKLPIIPKEKLDMCKSEEEKQKLFSICQSSCQYDCQSNCMFKKEFETKKVCDNKEKSCQCEKKENGINQ